MMAKLNFQQPLLQSSVSHDPSEIILIFLLIINVDIFEETVMDFFRILLQKFIEHLFKIQIVCNIIIVFTVDQLMHP